MNAYSSAALVQIPTLDAQRAVALGTQILAAAKSEAPVPLLQKPQGRVETTLDELKQALLPLQPAGEDSAAAIDVDRRLDAAWSGLCDCVTGWAKLPRSVPQSAKAKILQELAFSDGLKFTKIGYMSQWSESGARLEKLCEEPNAALVRELGAEPFLEEVKNAHRLFGEVTGITDVRKEDEPPEVRSKMVALFDAMRSYILHVVVHSESGEPGAEEAAQKLLAPVLEMRKSKRAPKAESQSKETPVVPS